MMQGGAKSQPNRSNQSADETTSQHDVGCDAEHDVTSSSVKESSNEHVKVEKQKLPPIINNNHDVSEETLDKENVSILSRYYSC